MKKYFEFETTQFDFELIQHIKKLRLKEKFSQEALSIKMGLAKSFIGNVENYREKHKYSTRHITLLAKAFGFKNIGELLDFPTPKLDRIKVTVEQTYNETETKVIKTDIVKIETL